MNAVTALAHGTHMLTKAGITTGRLDSLILLEDSLHQDRAWILAHPEAKLTAVQLNSLQRKLKRRATHLPLSYVRGHSEFYGRRFRVNRHVLEPRPETETMIDLLKKLPLPEQPVIADVGTGSGCLGITAALEIPDSQVDLYDISSSALGVAKHNSVAHELHLHARKMNLLARPIRSYDVVLANLPYVPKDYPINKSAAMEPRLAIFGGRDGLNIYRMFFEQLSRHRKKPWFILCESLPQQHKALASIALEAGYKLLQTQDFIQVFSR